MADFQITLHHPDFPDDAVFEVEGVGEVKNGDSFTVTDDMQTRFELDRGYSLKDSLEENPIIGVGKAKPNVQTNKRTPNERRSDGLAEEVEEALAESNPDVKPADVLGTQQKGGES